ncbi:MAG: hypothetical protein JWP69_2251 [Flaviaesturariibacter sp.]|nr:hypothetical protein [Flaviaesturariibacter sp.]
MRFLSLLPVFALCFSACKKNCPEIPEPLPSMRYINLQDQAVGRGTPAFLDLDGDGHRDLGFSVILVGDPSLPGDKTQFYATGSFNTFFPINAAEESPRLEPGATIHATAFAGYDWFNAPAILLAQRVELVNGTLYWEGPWKHAAHRFLPFYILRDSKRYFGWIEISFNTATQQTILHRAAVSEAAEKGVKAGI